MARGTGISGPSVARLQLNTREPTDMLRSYPVREHYKNSNARLLVMRKRLRPIGQVLVDALGGERRAGIFHRVCL